MKADEASLDIQQLRANADAAGQLLKALSNPDRLLLLCQLSQGERNVSELESAAGYSAADLVPAIGRAAPRRAWWRPGARASRSTTASAARRRWR